MWTKLIGAVLVVAACAGLGADAAFCFRKRLLLLEKLKLMVTHLKGEILYANAPLPEAFDRTGRRSPGPAGALFTQVSMALRKETGERFEVIWKREAGDFAKGSVLSKKEREQLLQFGEHLGYLDREMQEKTILFYIEDLEESIGKLRQQEPEKCKLFFSMGILSGLFLAVIMI